MRFRDRTEAGRQLARELERFRGARTVVLGLVRGGVLVAREVARALAAPLEPMVALPLCASESPDFELGAIAEGGGAYVDPDALLEAGLRDADVEAIAEREGAELARRVRLYRGGHPLRELAGATVLVVDDAVATGATARAAARAARKAGAARVVLAAPVIAGDRVAELRADFDEVVALESPDHVLAAGVWYERFAEVDDGELLALLGRNAAAEGGAGGDADPRGATEDPPAGQPHPHPPRD
ncbi:MAG TPA: phosphoribosyltransferase family protein [Anaeromyxobacter sp.]